LTNGYTKFVAGKLVFYIIVMVLAVTIVFFVTVSMPGDPVEVMLARGSHPIGVDIESLENTMRAYFGLNRPLLDRYVTYLAGIFTGNLGMSFTNYPVSVVDVILFYLPYTLALAIPVLIISFFLGNWIGARAAYLKGKRNEATYFGLVFCNQLPTFWFAMVLVFLYVVVLHSIPPIGARTQGMIPDLSVAYILDLLAHWILPFLTLIVVYLGAWATGMRSMVTHEMDSGYVRYAEQLGFRKGKLVSYTERNAILPQFTGLNLVLSGIIGNTLIIEIVFGWPGIGLLLFNSVGTLDYPVVFGCFLVIVLIIVIGNFLIDILYGFLDPRIRTGHG
jgi:peptide/nickel transport system permease protein